MNDPIPSTKPLNLEQPSPEGLAAVPCYGGFCWCDMCGYVATLTEPMLKEWDEDDADSQACYRICQLCEDSGMDSHLRHGREMPDHIAEDDPMPAYSQNV